MNFNFEADSQSRTPSELVRALRDAIPNLHPPGLRDDESRKKVSEEAIRSLQGIKAILYGDGATEPVTELTAQLAQETYATDLLLVLVQNVVRFDFESRKDVVQVFIGLLRHQIGSRWPTIEYICAGHEKIVFVAFAGYVNEGSAHSSGTILREMLRHEQLAKTLLYSEQFYMFPHYIEKASFGISCDALTNLEEILTQHKPLVAEYLGKNDDRFFASFAPLFLSWSNVIHRRSLKLLKEILLDRANFKAMTRFIAQERHLMPIMNLLRSKSRNVQFEAFHVFKIFVANPKRPPEIEAILKRNKEKLLRFFDNFLNDRGDEQFNNEKRLLIVQIQNV